MTTRAIQENQQAYFIERLQSFRETPYTTMKPLLDRIWNRFETCRLPEKKNEAYKGFPLANLYQTEYCRPTAKLDSLNIEPFLYPESKGCALVFVDGVYNEQLSNIENLPKGVVIQDFSKAFIRYQGYFQNRLQYYIKEESDPFALFSLALMSSGLYLYVPPNVVVDHPIEVIHVYQDKTPLMASPVIMGVIGDNSSITLIEKAINLSQQPSIRWVNALIDMTLGERAKLQTIRLPSEDKKETFFKFLRIDVKANARFEDISLASGTTLQRSDCNINLKGIGASCALYGATHIRNDHQVHSHISINHLEPQTTSKQLFKSVLYDQSVSSFRGTIYVKDIAQKTDAYQLNNNLLLSDEATAESQPKLEIFADDVKASHGATTGQLDHELLFYLKTRGIEEKEAKALLIEAFCGEVIEKIAYPSIKKEIKMRFFTS